MPSAFAAASELAKSTKQYPACCNKGVSGSRTWEVSCCLLQDVREAMQHSSQTYPENLSRIILTLTCSPMPNQTLRTKFSSIHGSNSPILLEISIYSSALIALTPAHRAYHSVVLDSAPLIADSLGCPVAEPLPLPLLKGVGRSPDA